MGEITTVGLDLAKHVFQVHGVDADGAAVLRKQLRRAQVDNGLATAFGAQPSTRRAHPPLRLCFLGGIEPAPNCRGRDGHFCPPPAQIRTCGIPAYGSYLG